MKEEQTPKSNNIAEKAHAQRKAVFDPTGRVESINPDETKIADVRRHYVGLVLLYVQVTFGVLLGMGMILFFMSSLTKSSAAASLFAGLSLVIVFLGAIFLVLAARIYKSNQLIVTDKNITQVLQVGLFHRKVSELSMESVEDVTARQKGFLQTVFNFGTVTIETAGEQENFVFPYCPNPNAHAKMLLDARSAYFQNHLSAHH